MARSLKIRDDLFAVHWTLASPPSSKVYSIQAHFYDQVQSETGQFVQTAKLTYTSDQRSFKLDRNPPVAFIISFHFEDNRLELGLKSLPQVKFNGQQPQVTALLNGDSKLMERSSEGVWGPVFWTYTGGPENLNCPTFELLVDFQTPSTDASPQVLKSLTSFLANRSETDVEFCVRGERIRGHWDVLAASSPVFQAMFSSPSFTESQTRVVEVLDISPSVFRLLMEFLYNGHIPAFQDVKTFERLFAAADRYQIDSLKILCRDHLMAKLNLSNVIRILVLAHLHSCPQLVDEAADFAVKNRRTLSLLPQWRLFIEKYPQLHDLCQYKVLQSVKFPI